MYRYNDRLEYPKRKSPRLKHYDYSTPGYYFITICTHERKCIFGHVGELNRYGKIAAEGLEQISVHEPSAVIEKYVVMPNHIHAIVILKEDRVNLSVLMGLFKSFVSKRIHETDPGLIVWQKSFHDHKIRSQRQYEKIWMYIENNPVKWELDCFYSAQAEE